MDANVQSDFLKQGFTKSRMSFLTQYVLLGGLVVGGLILAGIMQFIIMLTMISLKDMMNSMGDTKIIMNTMALPQNFNKVVIMQALGTFLLMAVPSYFFAKIVHKNALEYLGFNKQFNITKIGLVIIITAVGLVLSGGLGEITKALPMTKSFRLWAEGLEKTYAEQVMLFINMKSFGSYLFSVVMIAILPAIFEEVLFRGAVQNLMIKSTNMPHLSIIITGFLFSLVHFSVMGFLSRMMLGIVLGYLFYFGKSLWLNILMHFINNAVGVTLIYRDISKGKSIVDSIDEGFPIWAGLLAFVAMIFLLIYYRKVCEKVDGEKVVSIK